MVAFHQNSPGRPEIVKAVLVNYDLYQQVLYFDENDSINNQHKIDTDFKLEMKESAFDYCYTKLVAGLGSKTLYQTATEVENHREELINKSLDSLIYESTVWNKSGNRGQTRNADPKMLWTKTQQSYYEQVLTTKFSVITGGYGSGKTEALKLKMLSELDKSLSNVKIIFAVLTPSLKTNTRDLESNAAKEMSHAVRHGFFINMGVNFGGARVSPKRLTQVSKVIGANKEDKQIFMQESMPMVLQDQCREIAIDENRISGEVEWETLLILQLKKMFENLPEKFRDRVEFQTVARIQDLNFTKNKKYHILIDEFLTNDPKMEYGDHDFRIKMFTEELIKIKSFCTSNKNVLSTTIAVPELYHSMSRLKINSGKYFDWSIYNFGGRNYRCSNEIIEFLGLLEVSTGIKAPIGETNKSFSGPDVQLISFESILCPSEVKDDIQYDGQIRLSAEALDCYSDSLIICSQKTKFRYLMAFKDFELVRSKIAVFNNDTNRPYLSSNGIESNKLVLIIDGEIKDGKLINCSFEKCVLDLFKIITRCRHSLTIIYPGRDRNLTLVQFADLIKDFSSKQFSELNLVSIEKQAVYGIFDDIECLNKDELTKEVDWKVMHENIVGSNFMNEGTLKKLRNIVENIGWSEFEYSLSINGKEFDVFLVYDMINCRPFVKTLIETVKTNKKQVKTNKKTNKKTSKMQSQIKKLKLFQSGTYSKSFDPVLLSFLKFNIDELKPDLGKSSYRWLLPYLDIPKDFDTDPELKYLSSFFKNDIITTELKPHWACMQRSNYLQGYQDEGWSLNLSANNIKFVHKDSFLRVSGLINSASKKCNKKFNSYETMFKRHKQKNARFLSHHRLNTKIIELPSIAIRYITQLVLTANNIDHLHPDTFKCLPYLLALALDNNLLETLPCDIFRHNRYLSWLNLGANELQTLPPGIFKHNGSLLSLTLLDNPKLKHKIDTTGLKKECVFEYSIYGERFANVANYEKNALERLKLADRYNPKTRNHKEAEVNDGEFYDFCLDYNEEHYQPDMTSVNERMKENLAGMGNFAKSKHGKEFAENVAEIFDHRLANKMISEK